MARPLFGGAAGLSEPMVAFEAGRVKAEMQGSVLKAWDMGAKKQTTFGSLFAGIGGIDLGLESSGMKCVWQVENDAYCQRVLPKHWPHVRRWDDVRTFPPEPAADWACDLIAGGFPCQDISNAGRRAGIDGARSGLWVEFARIVCLLRPQYVLVENVPALTIRGLSRVLGDLAAIGFNAEWDCIPAAAVGAPHSRWRIFILAYAQGALVSNAVRDGWSQGESESETREWPRYLMLSGGQALSNPASQWFGQRWRYEFAAYCESQRNLYWPDAKPPVCGVAHGVPHRVDRLRGLGNAVVPQVVEWIGRRIMNATNESR